MGVKGLKMQAHIYMYSTSLGIWNEIQKIKLCTDFFIVPLTVFFIFFISGQQKRNIPSIRLVHECYMYMYMSMS